MNTQTIILEAAMDKLIRCHAVKTEKGRSNIRKILKGVIDLMPEINQIETDADNVHQVILALGTFLQDLVEDQPTQQMKDIMGYISKELCKRDFKFAQ